MNERFGGGGEEEVGERSRGGGGIVEGGGGGREGGGGLRRDGEGREEGPVPSGRPVSACRGGLRGEGEREVRDGTCKNVGPGTYRGQNQHSGGQVVLVQHPPPPAPPPSLPPHSSHTSTRVSSFRTSGGTSGEEEGREEGRRGGGGVLAVLGRRERD